MNIFISPSGKLGKRFWSSIQTEKVCLGLFGVLNGPAFGSLMVRRVWGIGTLNERFTSRWTNRNEF